MQEEVYGAVARALERREAAALVTIVNAVGSTPQRVGAKMLVFADGRTVGTIGGGCYEDDAFWKARAAIERGQPQFVRYDLTDDFAEESGLICGGHMEVYIEPIEPAPRLYIVGAGHVAFHLARLAREVGFRIHVLDDRAKFANRQRFPDADEVIVDAIPEWLHRADLPARSYAVIVTRGHRHDLDALRELVSRDLRYVGLIGSRAKVVKIYEALVAESVAPDDLRRVHAPIGLDIGAVTPQEIAVSIVAELIAVKYGKITPDAEAAGDASSWSLRWAPKAVKVGG
jgi:xanthine dehydrogenase accessory factor